MTLLGRYEIIDKLGTGSMGVVYRARDTLLEREVALKTILTGVGMEPEIHERFYREARACARLQHPSIVVVYDLGEADRVAYIAMELLEGMDLRKLIDRRTPIPLVAKLEAMSQISEALAYAHRHRIIHRDIKPSNLFLTSDKRAKVLDFGIARLPTSQLTVQGMILGTPNYMAPEQIRDQPCDSRTDLFSAAVVFFEFLANVHPFQDEVIARRIVESEPKSLSGCDPTLPLILDRIFVRALAKDPSRRYRTGDEFAADLRCVLGVLLGNASPALSDLQLPSERETFVQGKEPATETEAAAASYKLHLTELMSLVEGFDRAVAAGNLPLARETFSKIENLGAVDSRLAEAGELYRGRLSALERQPQPYAFPQAKRGDRDSSSATGIAARTCTCCGAANRTAAVYCIQCGADLDTEPLPEPAAGAVTPSTSITDAGYQEAVVPSPPPPIPIAEPESPTGWFDPPAPVRDPVPAPPPLVGTVAPRRISPGEILEKIARSPYLKWPSSLVPVASLLKTRRSQQILLWTGTGVAGVILVGVLVTAAKPIPTEPFVATARVASAKARIYKNARTDSSAKPAIQNELVHILRLPERSEQTWVPVQTVTRGKAARPGFMHVSELSQWDSSDADSKLSIVLMFHSRTDAAGTDTEGILAALQDIFVRFPGTRAGRRAHLERSRIQLDIARSLKDQGKPLESIQQELESATTDLEAGAGESPATDAAIRQQIDALREESLPPPQREAPPDPRNRKKSTQSEIDKMLAESDVLWQDQKTDETEALVDKILHLQKDNQHALELRKLIELRRDLYRRYKK